jgi:TRAP-type C4-dicarboxylate transport system substrate-binding protein
MKTKSILSILALCFCLLIVFTGCGGNDNAGAPADNSSDATEPDATEPAQSADNYPTADNPLTLRISIPFPETIDLGAGYAVAAEKINAESGGALIAKVSYDGTLLAFDDTFQGVSTGTADIGWLGPANVDSNLALNRVTSMTFDSVPGDIFKLLAAYREIYANTPALHEELAEYNLAYVSIQACSPCVIGTNKTSVKTPDDVKGLQINSIGFGQDYLKALGANAVTISAGDYYLSMERGVIDGMYDGITTFFTFGMYPLVNHVLVLGEENTSDPAVVNGIAACPDFTVANLDTWKKLSPEQQKLICDAFDYGIETATMGVYYADTANSVNAIKDNGATITYVTGDALKPWLEAKEPIVQAWIDSTAAKGYPAQEVYDYVNGVLANAK